MNKYELAARLAAHGLDDDEIRSAIFLMGDDAKAESNFRILASTQQRNTERLERSLESARKHYEPFAAVLAEIEEAENPEPASDDVLCARCDHSDCSDPSHEPNTPCHPFQPAQGTMRYASGEEPAKDGDLRATYPDKLRGAADSIVSAFSWNATREGFDYWARIHDRLLEIAATAEDAK